MPFGVDEYPNQIEPSSLVGSIVWLVVIVAVFSIIIIGGILLIKRK